MDSNKTKEPEGEQVGNGSPCLAVVADEKATTEFLLVISLVRQETFVLCVDGIWHKWDITEANRLLDQRQAPVEQFRPADWDICPQHLLERYPDLDVDYARELTEEDMERPLLFVPIGGRHQLIDGWHRLYKAVTSGILSLPARVLSEEEAQAVLMERKPAKP